MAALSGQITVTTAGTEVQGPDVQGVKFAIHAHKGNVGVVYFGNDGANAVSSTTGYQLSQGEAIEIEIANLSKLWFDAATNGDKFSWLLVDSIRE